MGLKAQQVLQLDNPIEHKAFGAAGCAPGQL